MPRLIQLSLQGDVSFTIFKNITRIGSDETCDIKLTSEGIHPDHAHILSENDNYYIAASGRNRSLKINSKSKKKSVLVDGDIIEFADIKAIFRSHNGDSFSSRKDEKTVLRGYRDIVNFSQKLITSSDLDELLKHLMDKVVDLTEADRGFLILFDNGKPAIKIASNIEKEDLGELLEQLSDSILQKVIKEKQPLIVNDALNDVNYQSSQSVMNLQIHSVMCVPLTDRDNELLGVIYLGSNTFKSLFAGTTLDLVTVFAAQASLLIRNIQTVSTLKADNDALRRSISDSKFGELIGSSDIMESTFKKIKKVAPTDISVLLTGETGTGKELFAKEIHNRSDRADKPFVVVNCGAIPENLLESELFGHVKGAFTGAVGNRLGRFQMAHHGTLFLDEIGELPVLLQVKLLRALQEQVIHKVGSSEPETVDIRVIAATNRNLQEEIKSGSFREDLFYRLNVIGIHLPPLRERGDDIMLLARYLLGQFAQKYNSDITGFAPSTIPVIKKYGWPGNIRELENRLKKAVIMTDGSSIIPEDMELSDDKTEVITPLARAKEQFVRRYILDVLERNNGNKSKSARDLGIDPRTIFRYLEEDAEE